MRRYRSSGLFRLFEDAAAKFWIRPAVIEKVIADSVRLKLGSDAEAERRMRLVLNLVTPSASSRAETRTPSCSTARRCAWGMIAATHIALSTGKLEQRDGGTHFQFDLVSAGCAY